MASDLETRIRTRAYHIWENNPSSDGDAQKHWDEAQRQIEAEGDLQSDAPQGGADQSSDRERGGRLAPEEQLQDLSVDDPEPGKGEQS